MYRSVIELVGWDFWIIRNDAWPPNGDNVQISDRRIDVIETLLNLNWFKNVSVIVLLLKSSHSA